MKNYLYLKTSHEIKGMMPGRVEITQYGKIYYHYWITTREEYNFIVAKNPAAFAAAV
jgi:hypothetical protein